MHNTSGGFVSYEEMTIESFCLCLVSKILQCQALPKKKQKANAKFSLLCILHLKLVLPSREELL